MAGLNGSASAHATSQIPAQSASEILPPAIPAPVPATPPQWFQGYLTYSGLILSLIGFVSAKLGLHLSSDQVNGVITWAAANWDQIAGIAGLIVAACGRYRAELRHWREHLQAMQAKS
jgi:hypothetical protein